MHSAGGVEERGRRNSASARQQHATHRPEELLHEVLDAMEVLLAQSPDVELHVHHVSIVFKRRHSQGRRPASRQAAAAGHIMSESARMGPVAPIP